MIQQVNDDQDAALILRAVSGRDSNAFGQLVVLHQGKVRSFLRRLCREPALADDLAQESFLIAYKKLSSYRGSGRFSAWLCSIAYRRFLQYERERRREARQHEDYAEEVALVSDDYEAITPLQLDLERMLLQLDPQEAAAITLNFTHGFAHAEVATIMQLPLGTVKSLINRAMPKLRLLMRVSMEVSET